MYSHVIIAIRLDCIMHGGNISRRSSFVVIFVYFPGYMDAVISQCLLAASKTFYTVQTVYCCWQGVQQSNREENPGGFCIMCRETEAVMACIVATQHRIIPPLYVAF